MFLPDKSWLIGCTSQHLLFLFVNFGEPSGLSRIILKEVEAVTRLTHSGSGADRQVKLVHQGTNAEKYVSINNSLTLSLVLVLLRVLYANIPSDLIVNLCSQYFPIMELRVPMEKENVPHGTL